MQDGRATISQVARAAGVARSSVSRAFTRPEMLNPETVQRIRTAAASLNYEPNRVARALSTGRHGTLAVVVPDIANPFFPPLIRAAQQAADARAFCVFLGDSGEDAAAEVRLARRFVGQVEGLILVSPRMGDEELRALAGRLPVVLVNRDTEGIARVLIDSGMGVRQAVAHLADLGHRRLAYVAGPARSWANAVRRAAAQEAAAAAGMQLSVIGPAYPSHEGGRAIVPAVLDSGASAVIAFDDMIARGICAALLEDGLAVPERLSVVGCDDVLGNVTWPPLTSVSNRSAEAGALAFAMLAERLEGAGTGARRVLETALTLRATTGAAPQPG